MVVKYNTSIDSTTIRALYLAWVRNTAYTRDTSHPDLHSANISADIGPFVDNAKTKQEIEKLIARYNLQQRGDGKGSYDFGRNQAAAPVPVVQNDIAGRDSQSSNLDDIDGDDVMDDAQPQLLGPWGQRFDDGNEMQRRIQGAASRKNDGSETGKRIFKDVFGNNWNNLRSDTTMITTQLAVDAWALHINTWLLIRDTMLWAWGTVSARKSLRTQLRQSIREQTWWVRARRAWICDNLLIPTDEEESVQASSTRRTNRLKRINTLKFNYDELRSLYKRWSRSRDVFELWMSVIMAIGTRKTGVIFEPITFAAPTRDDLKAKDVTQWIIQRGVLKDKLKRVTGKVRDSNRWVLKPILFDDKADAIIKRIQTIRNDPTIRQSVLTATAKFKSEAGAALTRKSLESRISNIGSKEVKRIINRELGKNMSDVQRSAFKQKSHLLRAIYAVTAYSLFQEDVHMDQAKFISEVLGHGGTSAASAYTHIAIKWGFYDSDQNLTWGNVKQEIARVSEQLAEHASNKRKHHLIAEPAVADAVVRITDVSDFADAARRAKEANLDGFYIRVGRVDPGRVDEDDSVDVKIPIRSWQRRVAADVRKEFLESAIQSMVRAGVKLSAARFRDIGISAHHNPARDVINKAIQEQSAANN